MSKHFKTRKRHVKLITSALSVFCLAMLIIVAVYAWLWEEKTKPHTIVTSSVNAVAVIYFEQPGDDEEDIPGEEFKDDNGYYMVNLDDPEAGNYFNNLRVKIRFQGVTFSYLRVHVADMGSFPATRNDNDINAVYLKQETKFIIDPDYWVDNRIHDDFYYYIYDHNTGYGPGVFRAEDVDDVVELDFISGIADMEEITNGTLRLDINVEVVQFNRIDTFWDDMNDLSSIID